MKLPLFLITAGLLAAFVIAQEGGWGVDRSSIDTGSATITTITASTITLTNLNVGAQAGIAATVDVIVAGETTNRLVYVGGILVSNITDFWP